MRAFSWASECRVQEVDQIGAVFVGVGFSFLIFGILAEFQATRLRRKWTRNGKVRMPSKKAVILLQLIGLGNNSHVEDRDETELFFDPDNELAAFAAQQQAVLNIRTG